MAAHQRASVTREMGLFSLELKFIFFLSKTSKYLKKVTEMIMRLKKSVASE